MSAPLCTVCLDTGSKSQDLYSDLDCTACEAAKERVALMRALKGTEDLRNVGALTWRAYQLGKAAAAPVVPVAAQPVVQVPEMTDQRIFEWAEGFVFTNKGMPHKLTFSRPRFVQAVRAIIANLPAAPHIEAQPAGEVVAALKVARAALHTAEYAIKGREHTGFITIAIAVIDKAMAQGDKA